MNKIQIINGDHLKFEYKDIFYSIEGYSDIKSFIDDIGSKNFKIYDDYNNPLINRLDSVLNEMQKDSTYQNIQYHVKEVHPDVLI